MISILSHKYVTTNTLLAKYKIFKNVTGIAHKVSYTKKFK